MEGAIYPDYVVCENYTIFQDCRFLWTKDRDYRFVNPVYTQLHFAMEIFPKKPFTYTLKKVMYEAFIGKLTKEHIGHLDNDPMNCNLDNLYLKNAGYVDKRLIDISRSKYEGNPFYKMAPFPFSMYAASADGFIVNMITDVKLKGSLCAHDYLRTSLTKETDAKAVRFQVHRFIHWCNDSTFEIFNEKLQVNHKDGNRSNNVPSNLETVTYEEHQKLTRQANLDMHSKADLTRTKEVVKIDERGFALQHYNNMSDAVQQTGLSEGQLRYRIQGKCKPEPAVWAWSVEYVPGEKWYIITKNEASTSPRGIQLLKGLRVSNKQRILFPDGRVCLGKEQGGRLKFTYNRIHHAVAQVICYIYNGPPESSDLTAEHRDRNPLNNDPNNLYWATKAQQSNNIGSNLKVKCTCVITKEIFRYTSIAVAAAIEKCCWKTIKRHCDNNTTFNNKLWSFDKEVETLHSPDVKINTTVCKECVGPICFKYAGKVY